MSTYAIGDIQGCHAELMALLDSFRFDPERDRLWVAGDLVNRGPKSLEVLRFVRSLGAAATVVLGNHDLYLLMLAAGFRRRAKSDTLAPVLNAPDRDDLLDWLATRPLMHVEAGHALVHAGLLPQWTVERARELAAEVERALRGKHRNRFLSRLHGNTPERWSEQLSGADRLRCIVNAMTRMRFCSAQGEIDFAHKGAAEDAPPGFRPWFAHRSRASTTHTIVCGHWSALGFYRQDGLLALDSGCLWGGALTAVRLDDGEVFQLSCPL